MEPAHTPRKGDSRMETNGTAPGLSVFTVLKAVKRRKLYLLMPVLVLTAGAGIYALRLPERFRARALIAAEPAIAAHYLADRVDAAATANVQEQLRVVRETLFTPPVLEMVIREFKLYDLGDKGLSGPVMEEMKSRIPVQVEEPDTFSVGFEGENRQQVTQVANRLAELFIERTADLRGQRAAQADSFLDTEVERLRNQLSEQEESLKTYKQGAVEELPERLTTNLKLFENLQQQVRAKTDQITEGQARRSAAIEEIQALEKQGALEQPGADAREIRHPRRPAVQAETAQGPVHVKVSGGPANRKRNPGLGGDRNPARAHSPRPVSGSNALFRPTGGAQIDRSTSEELPTRTKRAGIRDEKLRTEDQRFPGLRDGANPTHARCSGYADALRSAIRETARGEIGPASEED